MPDELAVRCFPFSDGVGVLRDSLPNRISWSHSMVKLSVPSIQLIHILHCQLKIAGADPPILPTKGRVARRPVKEPLHSLNTHWWLQYSATLTEFGSFLCSVGTLGISSYDPPFELLSKLGQQGSFDGVTLRRQML